MNSAELNAFARDTFRRCHITLLTTTAAALDRHRLPAESQTFLTEVGLPDRQPFNFDFGLAVRLPTIAEVAQEQNVTTVVPEVCRDWPCIAWVIGSVVTLDPRQDAGARLIDLTGKDNPCS
jgi:hypothetical protein